MIEQWTGWRTCPPLEWMRIVRDGLDLSKPAKAVAFCMALHALPDGTNARPGTQKLAWESGASRRAVVGALGDLERIGVLCCVDRGSAHGVRGGANHYTLTTHDDIGAYAMTYQRWLASTGATAVESPAEESAESYLELPGAPTALYRYLDEAGTLLYVGITGRLKDRESSHIKASSWMEFMCTSRVERFPDRPTAAAAEKAAVLAERPIFNVQYNDTPEARHRAVDYLIARGRLDLLAPAITRG